MNEPFHSCAIETFSSRDPRQVRDGGLIRGRTLLGMRSGKDTLKRLLSKMGLEDDHPGMTQSGSMMG